MSGCACGCVRCVWQNGLTFVGGLRIFTLMVFGDGITVEYGAKEESEWWRSCVQFDLKRSMQMSNRRALSTGSAAADSWPLREVVTQKLYPRENTPGRWYPNWTVCATSFTQWN